MSSSFDNSEPRYWPFEVLEPEHRTRQHQAEIDFLESAYRQGFTPYTFSAGNLGAICGVRGGMILIRGRNRWEAILGLAHEKTLSMFLDDFDCAARAILQWLPGLPAEQILADSKDHLVTMPGASRKYFWHDREVGELKTELEPMTIHEQQSNQNPGNRSVIRRLRSQSE